MIKEENKNYCNYSDLPSPMAYMLDEEIKVKAKLSNFDIDRIIKMAWEEAIPFDVIEQQFGLKKSEVKALMKKKLKFSSYLPWLKRVENCKTNHIKRRSASINKFKCDLKRTITHNKISKK